MYLRLFSLFTILLLHQANETLFIVSHLILVKQLSENLCTGFMIYVFDIDRLFKDIRDCAVLML